MDTRAEGIHFYPLYSSRNINWTLEFKGIDSPGSECRVFHALVAAEWDFIHFSVRLISIKELTWPQACQCSVSSGFSSLLETREGWMSSSRLPTSCLSFATQLKSVSEITSLWFWWQKEGGMKVQEPPFTILNLSLKLIFIDSLPWTGAAETQAHIVLCCPSYADSQVAQNSICWRQNVLNCFSRSSTTYICAPQLYLAPISQCFHISGAVVIALIQDIASKTAYTEHRI